MAWTLYLVPTTKKSELETILRDDLISRQSHKLRDAAAQGGPAGQLYVFLEGSMEAIGRADGLLPEIGEKLKGSEAEALFRRLKEEDEAASAGMGLFFTDE